MPLYKYECTGCGDRMLLEMTFEQHGRMTTKHDGHVELLDVHLVPDTVKICGAYAQVFDFQYKRPMPEHYSDQLDTVVTSERHYKSELSRMADEYSVRTGMDVSYDLVDPTDPSSAGATDAGLESQERAHHDAAAAVGEHTVRSFT